MLRNRMAVAVMTATALLVGCGDSGDDRGVNITVEPTPTTPTTPTTPEEPNDSLPPDAPSPDLPFVSYNNDFTVGTLNGTITEDITLVREIEWRLDGVVRVGEGNKEVTNDADVQAIKDAGVTLTIESGTHVRGED